MGHQCRQSVIAGQPLPALHDEVRVRVSVRVGVRVGVRVRVRVRVRVGVRVRARVGRSRSLCGRCPHARSRRRTSPCGARGARVRCGWC